MESLSETTALWNKEPMAHLSTNDTCNDISLRSSAISSSSARRTDLLLPAEDTVEGRARPVGVMSASPPKSSRTALEEANVKQQLMYARFQAWALRNYGELGKTKTVTRGKYNRVKAILKGEEPANADNSKLRFWVKAKGFRLGRFPCKVEDNEGGSDRELLYIPSKHQSSELTPGEKAFKRVAVVEDFFDIIYNVHVEMDGRGGKHAGQKRTYRAIAQTYAFLPREAVTKFLMSCSDCQKRMHLTMDSSYHHSGNSKSSGNPVTSANRGIVPPLPPPPPSSSSSSSTTAQQHHPLQSPHAVQHPLHHQHHHQHHPVSSDGHLFDNPPNITDYTLPITVSYLNYLKQKKRNKAKAANQQSAKRQRREPDDDDETEAATTTTTPTTTTTVPSSSSSSSPPSSTLSSSSVITAVAAAASAAAAAVVSAAAAAAKSLKPHHHHLHHRGGVDDDSASDKNPIAAVINYQEPIERLQATRGEVKADEGCAGSDAVTQLATECEEVKPTAAAAAVQDINPLDLSSSNSNQHDSPLIEETACTNECTVDASPPRNLCEQIPSPCSKSDHPTHRRCFSVAGEQDKAGGAQNCEVIPYRRRIDAKNASDKSFKTNSFTKSSAAEFREGGLHLKCQATSFCHMVQPGSTSDDLQSSARTSFFQPIPTIVPLPPDHIHQADLRRHPVDAGLQTNGLMEPYSGIGMSDKYKALHEGLARAFEPHPGQQVSPMPLHSTRLAFNNSSFLPCFPMNYGLHHKGSVVAKKNSDNFFHPDLAPLMTMTTRDSTSFDKLAKSFQFNELVTIRQIIAGYRDSAAFLRRSADELELLLLQQKK